MQALFAKILEKSTACYFLKQNEQFFNKNRIKFNKVILR
ncbi:hypothetical protein CYK57_01888 [Actinobacillus pleuropneumoniae]|nr:hypothetical protein appser10_17110 [Actinobacillus pleuropneumoniae serovar 10 str. D13039]QSZ39706.1 hypothetical protein CYK57_01888 [Actinobacillus pleuropneumoniae]